MPIPKLYKWVDLRNGRVEKENKTIEKELNKNKNGRHF